MTIDPKNLKSAKRAINDPKMVDRILKQSSALLKKNKHRLKDVQNDVKDLIGLVKAWAKRDYKKVRTSTILWILAALLYFINPLDAIPDFIIGYGFIDDISMISFVVSSLKRELEDFRAWKSSQ